MATNDYKKLAQGQLPSTAGALYTAPTGKKAIIRRITIVNTDSVDRTFQLFQSGTTDANALTPVFTLLAGGMAVDDDVMTLDDADTLEGVASVASKLTYTVQGDEITP